MNTTKGEAVISEESLERMTVAATVLGWHAPVPEAHWPERFDRGGKTYVKDHLTVARDGEVQCGEYVTEKGEWLIVYND